MDMNTEGYQGRSLAFVVGSGNGVIDWLIVSEYYLAERVCRYLSWKVCSRERQREVDRDTGKFSSSQGLFCRLNLVHHVWCLSFCKFSVLETLGIFVSFHEVKWTSMSVNTHWNGAHRVMWKMRHVSIVFMLETRSSNRWAVSFIKTAASTLDKSIICHRHLLVVQWVQ